MLDKMDNTISRRVQKFLEKDLGHKPGNLFGVVGNILEKKEKINKFFINQL